MAYDIGPRIGIDGESEFRKQLNNINTSLKTLKTELGKVSSEFADNAESEQALIAKNKVLQKSIDQQKKKIEEAARALDAAEQKFGENSNEALRWQQVLNSSQTDLNNLQNELRANDKALEEMSQGLRDVETGLLKVDDAAESVDDIKEKFKGGITTAATAWTAAITGIGVALAGAAESSREYRTNMGKLDTAFTTSGHSAEAARSTYKELVGVLGESDRSVEAANHLAKLTDNEKELQTWTDICTGVFATFGDSLPIEGLTEAANETAKVGQVTGPLADALNWAGISEDEFNKQLAACSDEQERQKLIMDTLNDVYDDAAKTYKDTNKEVIAANKAQDRLNEAIANLGKMVEPIMTALKNFAARALEEFVKLIEKIRELPGPVQAAIGIFTGLIAMAGPAALAFIKIKDGIEGFKKAASGINAIFGKKAAATTVDTAATTANTTATAANTKATNALAKAKSALSKVLTVGKWVALGAAIAGAGYLIYQFAKDSTAASDMVMGFADNVSGIIDKVVEIMPQIVNAIIAALPVMIEAGVQIFMALVNGITTAIPILAEAIPQILTALVNAITTNLPTIISGAIQIIMALVQGLIQAIPQLIAAIPQIITALVNAITTNLPTIISGAIQIIIALAQGLIQAIPQLVAAIPQIIAAIVQGIISLLGQIFNAGVQILKKLWSGISSWVSSLFSKVSSFAKQIPGKIKNGIGSLVSVGANWIKGLWNGIGNKVDWILDKIKGFGKSVLNGLKNIFKEHSPSKATEEIGEYFAEGFGIGVTREMAKVKKDIDKSMKGTLAMTEKTVATASGLTMPQAIDYDRLENIGAQAIYIDGRLIGRALRQPLLNQGVVMT